MGRQVRRVPLDFDQPINKTWPGYLSPPDLHGTPCLPCEQSGYSPQARALRERWYGNAPFSPAETGSEPYTPNTPEVWEFAQRNVERSPEYYGTGPFAVLHEAHRLSNLFNKAWCYHLSQADVDALVEAKRLMDFTHTFTRETRWQPKVPAYHPTAREVNLWSLQGMGHDSINCSVVVRAVLTEQGLPLLCSFCNGDGSTETYPGQRQDAENWEPTDPPTGPGWQLWETVSEGSPISPVFASDVLLAGWMASPAYTWGISTPLPFKDALHFVRDTGGWAPTMISSPETGPVSGDAYIGSLTD